MNVTALARMALVAAGLSLAAGAAIAAETANTHVPLQKAIGKPARPVPVTMLGVINSDGATLEDKKLTLSGVAGNVIIFTDRPARGAGQQTLGAFVAEWGKGKDNFAVNPPNATVSVLGGNEAGVADAVVTLRNPKLDGTTLVFDVDVLEGSLKGAKGATALFIDGRGGGGGGGGDHGGDDFNGDDYGGGNGWHNNGWNDDGYHAWYGAPVGDGNPYDDGGAFSYDAPPLCGYYPEPPC